MQITGKSFPAAKNRPYKLRYRQWQNAGAGIVPGLQAA